MSITEVSQITSIQTIQTLPSIQPVLALPTPDTFAKSSFDMFNFCDTFSALYKSTGEAMETTATFAKNTSETLRKNAEAHLQQIGDAAKTMSDKGFWEGVSSVAEYLFNLVSVFIGGTLIASGGGAIIGGALLTGGLLGFTNKALSDMGGWKAISKRLNSDVEYQKKLEYYIPLAVGILSHILCLSAGFSAHQINPTALTSPLKSLLDVNTGATAIRAILDGLLRYQRGRLESNLTTQRAELTKNEEQNYILDQFLSASYSQIEKILQTIGRHVKSAASIMDKQVSLMDLMASSGRRKH